MNEITLTKRKMLFSGAFKKVLLNKLLLLMMLFGTVSLNAQTSATPWFEGFTNATLPAGWTNSGFSLSSTVANLNSANPTAATGFYIYKNIYGTSSTSTTISGEFVLPSIGPILAGDKLSFTHKTINYSSGSTTGPAAGSGDFKVMISSDGGANYTTVSTIVNGSNPANWINYEYDLASYVGQTIKVKILASKDISTSVDYYVGFDNFNIGACSPPVLPQQSAATLNSVDLTSTDTTSLYQIEYGVYGFTQGTGTLTSTFTGSIQISGLNPSTVYGYYIKKICSADASSSWVGPFKMTTACGVLENVVENFDSTATGSSTNPSVPLCWGFIDSGSGYAYTTSGSGASSPNHFYYYNSSDTSGNYILVSPETNNLGNGTKQLRFLARSGTNGQELIVGTLSNPTSASTFTPLPGGTIALTTTYTEYVISVPAGTDDYFGFKHGVGATYRSIYIDDINLEPIPSCPGVNYGTGTATNVLATQAILSWESLSTNFEIQYGLEGFSLGTGTTISDVANNYLLSGLTQSTTYSYYVRSKCGTDYGIWRGPFTFTTQTVLPSPWFDGFVNGTADGWNNITTSVFNLSNNIGALAPSTDYYIYKNIYTEAGNGSGISSPNIGPILAGDIFSVKYKMVEYYSPYGPVDPSAGDIDVFISTDFGQNYSLLGNIPYNGVAGWQDFSTPLAAYLGQIVKLKFVVNYNYDEDDYIDHYLAFDNFYIGSCALPPANEVLTTTTTSATVSLAGEVTDSYEIEYGPVGFAQGTGTIISGTGTSIVIPGLQAATTYQYFLRRVCSTTNGSPWLGRYSFTTSCELFSDFVENFDTTPTGSSSNPTVPICWTFSDGGDGYGYVVSGNAVSTPNSFYMYNSSGGSYILISPETNNLGNGYYRVRFKAKSGTTGTKLQFGTMSNRLDASTFTQITEITLATSYPTNDYVVYLPVGTDDYFAFRHGNTSTYTSIYIDNVIYEPIPSCPAPVNLGVSKNLMDLTAQLTWQGPEVITNNNFEIEWGVSGFTLGTGTLATSTTYSTGISNLTLGQSYSFYVRRVCSGENTEWVGPYTFEMGYCSSIPTSNDGTGIGNVTIAGVSMDSPNDVTYEDFTNYEIAFNAGTLVPASVTFNTGWTYNTNIWIDLNNDGVFDNTTELLYVGESLSANPTTLDVSFTVPLNDNNVTGNYRMRIGTADSGQANPNSCYSGSFGVTVDLLVNITFPCLQPTDVNFTDVGYEYVTMDWEGQGNNNYEIEYGPVGFAVGSGTFITNVSKPYTVDGLTPGTTYSFYVRKVCAGVTTDWSSVATVYVFCDTPEPTGDSSQTLVSDELLSQLVINGQNLRFYTDPGLTQEVPASTAVQTSTTYYVTQTINCQSDSFLIVDLTVIQRIAQPVVNTNQSFCDGGLLSDISVTALPGATVYWFDSLTSETPLAPDTVLATGTYYVVQTDGVTTSHRKLVNVTLNPTPQPLVTQPIHLCGSYTFGNLSVNNASGTAVKWYASLTDTTPIANNTPVTTGTYYATQSYGVCESTRVAFEIAQFDALNRPVAATQVFCGSGTVSQLTATGVNGAQMLWYTSATAATPLAPTAQLATGTYYVAQTINGCYSDRRAVGVRVVSQAAPVLAPFIICGQGTIADLDIPVVNDVTYKWYTSPSATQELAQSTVLTTGTYFISRVQYGCESQRASVQVTVGTVPNAPTGPSMQSFMEGATVSNLVVNQTGVVWYLTYDDSQNGTNALQSYTQLQNGVTYYGVVIGSNGCVSLPLAVTVTVVLGNDEFVKEGLDFYPNPVTDILNVSYVDSIKQIEIFDILGKRVKAIKTDSTNIQIDMTDLASGTYMVQLKTDSKQQFIKVVKK